MTEPPNYLEQYPNNKMKLWHYGMQVASHESNSLTKILKIEKQIYNDISKMNVFENFSTKVP